MGGPGNRTSRIVSRPNPGFEAYPGEAAVQGFGVAIERNSIKQRRIPAISVGIDEKKDTEINAPALIFESRG